MIEEPSYADYFNSLALSGTETRRLIEVIEFYRGFLDEPIKSVFVSETIDQEGDRLVESLWLETERTLNEAHNVLTEDNFDVAVKPYFIHWYVKKREWMPGDCSAKSRLNIEYTGNSRLSGYFKASKENCDVLWQLVQSVLVPRTSLSYLHE